MVKPFLKIKRFRGIDNVSDEFAKRIGQNEGYVRDLDNIDIDDDGIIHRRGGYGSRIVNSTTVHSLWSDGTTCLFVDGTGFYKLNIDNSVTLLINGVDPTDRMAYVKVHARVYFSNNVIIGYIENGSSYPLPEPTDEFKIKMSGGHILEYYNSRLYAANHHNLFYSDPTVVTRMDKRKNAIAFRERITMIKAVSDGLFIGDAKGVYFLEGPGPEKFVEKPVLDIPAIEGTAITVEAQDGSRGVVPKSVMWMTEKGPYRGYSGGQSKHLQEGLFEMNDIDSGMIGCSVLKEDNGYRQYVVFCQVTPDVGKATGEIRLPRSTVAATD